MSQEEFVAGDWIDRLAQALAGLAAAPEPSLLEHLRRTPPKHVVYGGRDDKWVEGVVWKRGGRIMAAECLE